MTANEKMQKKPVGTREWYDFIGQLAEALPGIHMGGKEATNALLGMCQLDASSRVLDVGCGPGGTACLIAERYGARVYGVDLSEVMVEKAIEKAKKRGLQDKVEFRAADAYQLPFEDDYFDLVLLESVLTPLPGDKKEAMIELVRVTRPGGQIAVNESTVEASAPEELLALFEEHPAMYGYFNSQSLRSLFEQTGLEVVQMNEVRDVPPPSMMDEMGCGGLLSFFVRTYPKILVKLLGDARFRQASRIDDKITKSFKEHMGYTLIVGQKPG